MTDWRRLCGALALVLAVTVLSGCRDHNSWRQKLIIEVETPQGVVSGASVIQMESWFGQLPASGNEVNYEVTGEATVVDFGGGRYLFALLGGSAERFYHALEDRSRDRGRDLDRIARMQGESRILKPGNYPLLVTFADIDDPASVVRVDPDDLAATFGPGYTLSSITLAITDEPVTKGRVEAVLGWFYETRYLIPPDEKPRLAKDRTPEQNIGHLDFISGNLWRKE